MTSRDCVYCRSVWTTSEVNGLGTATETPLVINCAPGCESMLNRCGSTHDNAGSGRGRGASTDNFWKGLAAAYHRHRGTVALEHIHVRSRGSGGKVKDLARRDHRTIRVCLDLALQPGTTEEVAVGLLTVQAFIRHVAVGVARRERIDSSRRTRPCVPTAIRTRRW